ncbi:LOW QUALITY PROTEIN: hypothetical protein AAY473_022476 [Plecturocebus cupreus]
MGPGDDWAGWAPQAVTVLRLAWETEDLVSSTGSAMGFKWEDLGLYKEYMKQRSMGLIPVIPAFWEAKVGGSPEEFETSLANMMKSHLYQKYKISQAWRHMPIIPALWEAEADRSLVEVRIRITWGAFKRCLSPHPPVVIQHPRVRHRITFPLGSPQRSVSTSIWETVLSQANEPDRKQGEEHMQVTKQTQLHCKILNKEASAVAHTCNPSTLGGPVPGPFLFLFLGFLCYGASEISNFTPLTLD